MKHIATLALGSCYVDLDVGNMPYDNQGIPANLELIGGDYRVSAGGSAVNFCRLLQEVGVTTSFIGMVGDDDFGYTFEKLLEAAGVEPMLIRRPDVSTNVSTNLTSHDGKLHNMFVMGTANAALQAENVLPKLRDVVPNAQIFYLGGCFKLEGLQPGFGDIADIAETSGTVIVVDHGRIPKRATDEAKTIVKNFIKSAQFYLPSSEEFLTLWDVETVDGGLHYLHMEAPDLTVVVKDGENGAYYFAHGQKQHVPAVPVEKVLHLTGAGDSFNAGFIAAQVRHLPLEKAIEFGCAVAAARISGQEIPVIDWD
jgi:sugar/nucleoside kinase (ribokinase family)